MLLRSNKFLSILSVLCVVFVLVFSIANSSAMANGQETCPDGGDWDKKDDLSGVSYTYVAPEGKLIIEWCYKAATTVNYGTVSPPQSSISIESTVTNNNDQIQDISHASFRLIDVLVDTPESPTSTPVFTATNTATTVFTTTATIEDPRSTSTLATVPTKEPPTEETKTVLLPVTGGEHERNIWMINSILIFFALISFFFSFILRKGIDNS